MTGYDDLLHRVKNKTAQVMVVGLGYVGLPLAAKLAERGFKVAGVDTDKEKIETLKAGECPIKGLEPGLTSLLCYALEDNNLTFHTEYAPTLADAIIICVDTPVDDDHRPRYVNLVRALEFLPSVRERPQLIVIESTLAPGTMDNLVRPLLEDSGGVDGVNFYLAHVPERVMPGKLVKNLTFMHRTIGGRRAAQQQLAHALYSHIVEAEIYPVDCITAELVKVAENAYRDVNIAFANELALICEAVGANVWTVRDLVNQSPGRNVLKPGAGVGGHCIPKDPWLLVYGASEGLQTNEWAQTELIPAARLVNESMPEHMANKVVDALNLLNVSVDDAKVAILGVSYIENSDDDRNSPSYELMKRLKGRLLWLNNIKPTDPFHSDPYLFSLVDALEGADVVVLMTAHKYYHSISMREMYVWTGHDKNFEAVFIDGRGAFTKYEATAAGFIYAGIGEG